MPARNSLAAVTQSAVNQAIAEYDRLGQQRFLRKYGFREARDYWIVIGGKEYDSKAIMGAARAYAMPREGPLKPSDFSGGRNTVVKRLRALGFEIPNAPRNGVWRREELVLALDLYFRVTTLSLREAEAEYQALSRVLDQMGSQIGAVKTDTYRNSNGVKLKLMNFRRLDPAYQRQGKLGMSRGAKAEEAVWAAYSGDRTALAAEAQRVLAVLSLSVAMPPEDNAAGDDPYEAEEGGVEMRVHRRYERDRGLVRRKKASVIKNGPLICEACGFDFEARYGAIGSGFIEVHHKKPIYLIKPGEKTRLSDLAILCSNCHRIAHRRNPPLGVSEVSDAIKAAAAAQT